MSPFFSVVIPVYNRADALAAAIRSVLAQSCRDFEIVVVDDGSSDAPEKTAASFADARIRFVRQENKGAASARNRGIDMARGRFTAFLDSDDAFLPHHLAAMKRLLETRENTAGFAQVVADRGRGKRFLKPFRAPRADENIAEYLLCDRGFIPTITLVVETALARRVRYSEDARYGDDKDFAIRLSLAGCRFAMAQEPGAIWHDHRTEDRLSAGPRATPWLDRLRPQIPARAWHGYRGWVMAKSAPHGVARLRLYLAALLRGCYAPRMAAMVFLQVALPERLYRALCDATLARKNEKPARDSRPARALA